MLSIWEFFWIPAGIPFQNRNNVPFFLSKVTQSTPPDRLDQTGGECVGNGYRIRKVSFFF